MAGPRGTVWAVESQNAGKNTLINAIAKSVGKKVGFLTEAPVPGTTLGIVRVEVLLHGQAKLFHTPGLLNSYQITTRLTREEQKLVYVGKELKPITYRIKPPIGEKRVQELEHWVRKEFHVSGSSWDSSCVDVVAAGLGWCSIGVKGEAVLGVWTSEGVEVVLRNALILERVRFFEEFGFSVSKIVATAEPSFEQVTWEEGKEEEIE